jgi:CheY-like chemotaxis protein
MSIKILLADDSITIQKVIGIIFGGEEYSLTVVDNGKAAIDKAREVSPDVLLIDALMPGMSGYEVCEAVRATPALTQKPILLLTGSFEPFDEERAKSCGADAFLAKPFESQQIVTKVKELYALGASRSTEPSQPEPAQAAPAAGTTAAVNADDIWGAFTTPTAEPAPAVQAESNAPEAALEPDVFSIVGEVPETPLVPPVSDTPDTTGTSWIPVEEHTFEFEEETVADLPPTSFTGFEPPAQGDDSFGEVSFGEESVPVAAEPAAFAEPAPSFEAPPASAPLEPAAAYKAEPAPLVLTEEQLRAAVAAVSKDVIERIVWEVVPDLAEILIRDAIRKIKDGV